MSSKERLRILPKVDQLLEESSLGRQQATLRRGIIVRVVQEQIAALRHELSREERNGDLPADREAAKRWVLQRVQDDLGALQKASLRRVINATGVILHTNLGRASLSAEAAGAVQEVASGYVNLEYDLERGVRQSRMQHLESLLCRVFGAEAAFVVNNNAAAVLLAIDTLARRGVVVSRGEQIEIGDSFRLPEILSKAAVPIHEVGTTNRTSLADYVDAVSGPGCVFLKVHRSNFVLEGFTDEPPISDLVGAAEKCGARVVYDLGSGSPRSLSEYGLSGEPDAESALEAGSHVVTMSADKLIGGPQAGILVGGSSEIAAMRRNPLARALRIDKLTLAALHATLVSYAREGTADVPALRLILCKPEVIEARAQRILALLKEESAAEWQCRRATASIGGGAFAVTELPSFEVRARPRQMRATELSRRLRRGSPAVVARIKDDWIGLDARCIGDEEVEPLVEAMRRALHAGGGER